MKFRLKDFLNDLDITQTELCNTLNIPRNTMSNYCTGRTEPDFETLVKIADALNISLDSLLGRERKYIKITESEYKKLLQAKKALDEVISKIEK